MIDWLPLDRDFDSLWLGILFYLVQWLVIIFLTALVTTVAVKIGVNLW